MHGMMNVFYLSAGQLSLSMDSQEVLKATGLLLALLVCSYFVRHKYVTINNKYKEL